MSLFKPKNFDSILASVKRIHGLEHDATEAEVDAHLTGVKSYEEVEAAAAEAVQAEHDELQQKLDAANASLTTLQADVKRLETEATQLKADLTKAQAQVSKLEKEPAAPHTKGETETPENPAQKAWHNSGANVAARALAKRQKMPSPTKD